MKAIRTLKATEIDCRVGQVSLRTKKVSILLYKNARVDMAILDELVGAENWQRDHKEVKGNLYCGVGLHLNDSWVWKWDCGVESNTEKEKGEASDSFKRACVNWGIGRELYTAPRIWIPCTDKEWNDGKPFVDFSVSRIAYNEDKEITDLEIVDSSLNVRFRYGFKPERAAAPRAKKEAVDAGKVLSKAKYPTAWNSAVEKGKNECDFITLRETIEGRGFVVTPENWDALVAEINA